LSLWLVWQLFTINYQLLTVDYQERSPYETQR
jgi:hypothetical protein